VVPGGHVEMGETLDQALRREVMEETGLEIDNIEFAQFQDAINPPEYQKQRHYIFLDFFARVSGGEIKLNEELQEFNWFDPKTVLKEQKVAYGTQKFVLAFNERVKNKKHGLFGRECKDCEKLRMECTEYKTGWQRALADYKNLQAETSKRRGEWAQMSEVQILEEFIPVYEHLKMTVASCHSREGGNPDAWIEGVKYVLKQFADILKAHGVEEIKTVGEKFDPKYHEAAGGEEVEGKEAGEIVKEISGGYKVGERVIRAARVIIAK
jgi:molecular chaperone GrpE